MTKNTKAFTLIELLIVIVIIGILAVALLPRLTGAQKSARDTARKAAVQQIATAIEAYKNENNGALPVTTSLESTLQTAGLISSSLPKDPQGAAYTYITGSTAASGYAVIADIENPKGNLYSNSAANVLDTATGTATDGGFYGIIYK